MCVASTLLGGVLTVVLQTHVRQGSFASLIIYLEALVFSFIPACLTRRSLSFVGNKGREYKLTILFVE
ncbi:hypothetical protein FA95DRAFT_1565618 [Auriscalpium vulgare]|uniref:Uncharacterized protein n=1 Tax=Auriscalpium vulgare TaxID=40419 RepID=A0ACB8RAL5_9AGAM|nr:hypothetical protein FA95DRAFT_1565618 [Auriscalpium vulgare]